MRAQAVAARCVSGQTKAVTSGRRLVAVRHAQLGRAQIGGVQIRRTQVGSATIRNPPIAVGGECLVDVGLRAA